MTFPARRGEPATTYDYHAQDGTLVTVRTGKTGRFTPRDANEAALADAFGLPVAKGKGTDDTAGDEPAQEG